MIENEVEIWHGGEESGLMTHVAVTGHLLLKTEVER